MFSLFTGTIRFPLRLTVPGFLRWMRLIKKFGYKFEEENEVLYRALSLYSRVLDWKTLPLFVRKLDGRYEPCELAKELVAGPKGSWAYHRRYTVSVAQWVAMKHLLKQSDDAGMDHMVDRALELYERVTMGWLPELYSLDKFGEFEPFRFSPRLP
jgi:hypothetical protein